MEITFSPISLAVSDICSSCDNYPDDCRTQNQVKLSILTGFNRGVSLSRAVAAAIDMKLFCVGLVLLLVCFPVSELKRNLLKYDPEVNWDILRDDLVQAPTSADTKNTLPKLKRVPPFLVVSSSSDPVEAFKPEKGARDLPEALREMLLQAIGATPATPAPPTGEGCKGAVEVRCHIDRMFVRVKREIFKVNTAIRNLKLGTCTVNKVTDKYYYFLYPLTADCGFQTLVSKSVFMFILKNVDVLQQTVTFRAL